MITAGISAAFGILNALIPDIVGYFKKKQEMAERAAERAHELLMLDKSAELQMKLGAQKMDEMRLGGELQSVQEELRGSFKQMQSIYEQQKPIGIKWVDAWNAAMRPAACTAVLFVFTVGVTIYEVSVVVAWWQGIIPSADIMVYMFTGMVGETIQAVWGYLFGYRGTTTLLNRAKRV